MSRAHLISPAALLLLREPHSSQRSDALTAHWPLKESHCKARRCLVLERDPREAVPVPQPSVAREVEPVHWRLGKWVGVSGQALVGGFSIPGAQPPFISVPLESLLLIVFFFSPLANLVVPPPQDSPPNPVWPFVRRASSRRQNELPGARLPAARLLVAWMLRTPPAPPAPGPARMGRGCG